MAGLLYDPEKGDFPYNLPIFDNDNAVSAFTWRYLIDTYIANNGHFPDEEKFRYHLLEFMQMLADDLMETWDLVKENVMEEVRGNAEN